ncbi:basic salivary proline-rich protein 2-like [Meles meles]|uniref:basic salivary proline-rich protein 2-like n=1 Tax=Meles meles TaxID=9662 RepID=UPI001E69BC3B|nr:basic salivary proline-rich protein 2-like [Meles meles]
MAGAARKRRLRAPAPGPLPTNPGEPRGPGGLAGRRPRGARGSAGGSGAGSAAGRPDIKGGQRGRHFRGTCGGGPALPPGGWNPPPPGSKAPPRPAAEFLLSLWKFRRRSPEGGPRSPQRESPERGDELSAETETAGGREPDRAAEPTGEGLQPSFAFSGLQEGASVCSPLAMENERCPEQTDGTHWRRVDGGASCRTALEPAGGALPPPNLERLPREATPPHLGLPSGTAPVQITLSAPRASGCEKSSRRRAGSGQTRQRRGRRREVGWEPGAPPRAPSPGLPPPPAARPRARMQGAGADSARLRERRRGGGGEGASPAYCGQPECRGAGVSQGG